MAHGWRSRRNSVKSNNFNDSNITHTAAAGSTGQIGSVQPPIAPGQDPIRHPFQVNPQPTSISPVNPFPPSNVTVPPAGQVTTPIIDPNPNPVLGGGSPTDPNSLPKQIDQFYPPSPPPSGPAIPNDPPTAGVNVPNPNYNADPPTPGVNIPGTQPQADTTGAIIDGYSPGTEPTNTPSTPSNTNVAIIDGYTPGTEPTNQPQSQGDTTGAIIDGNSPGTEPTATPSNTDTTGAIIDGYSPGTEPPRDLNQGDTTGAIIDGYSPGTEPDTSSSDKTGAIIDGYSSGTEEPREPSAPSDTTGAIIDGNSPGTEPWTSSGDTTGAIIDGYTPGTEPPRDLNQGDTTGAIIDGYSPGTEPWTPSGDNTGAIIDGYTPGTEQAQTEIPPAEGQGGGDYGVVSPFPDPPVEAPNTGQIIDGYTPGTEEPQNQAPPDQGQGGGDYSVVSPPTDLEILTAKLDENARVLMEKNGWDWERARAQADVDWQNFLNDQITSGNNAPSAGTVPVQQNNLEVAIQQRDLIQNQINAVYDQGGTPSSDLEFNLALANNAVELTRNNASLDWKAAVDQASFEFNQWVLSQNGGGDPNSNPMPTPDIPPGFDPSGLNFG